MRFLPTKNMMPLHTVPHARIRQLNQHVPKTSGDFVLYWMVSYRRLRDNFALERAIEWAEKLNKPLVIVEPLRLRYKWASVRFHAFVVQGMIDSQAYFDEAKPQGVVYFPFIEQSHGQLHSLFHELQSRSCVVVSDDFPCFFIPQLLDLASKSVQVLMEAVDSNGIVPLAAADQTFSMAFHFRRWLQKNLRPFLQSEALPKEHPLRGLTLPAFRLPQALAQKFSNPSYKAKASADWFSELPIDHQVGSVSLRGGQKAAFDRLNEFLTHRMDRYLDRNKPDADSASGLSPYLHFGHISAHAVVRSVLEREEWSERKLAVKATGKNEGWWGTSPGAEGFLDELITWREIGFNFTSKRPDYDQFDSLPDWAKQTLTEHEQDPRTHIYSLEQFEKAQTHDALWNAAQRQLLRDGIIHNYLRMLWGKKILEWTKTPRDALRVMIELNNKYALDGRDPNSYSGIFWTLGRFDRPWAPQRPIFGMIRYMSSENTAKKMDLKAYLRKYSSAENRVVQQSLFES